MQNLIRLTVLPAAFLAASLACSAAPSPGFAQSTASQTAPQPRPIPSPDERVDINHASAAQLLKVPGMTPSWAGRIVRFRPYRTKLDLLDRGVLSGNVYDRIKDYVIAHREKQ